jgi:hypothetical protein
VIFRAALGTAAILASTGVLWAAGEYRRFHCVREHNTGCTVLPWTGHYEPPPVAQPSAVPTTEPDLEQELLDNLYGGG